MVTLDPRRLGTEALRCVTVRGVPQEPCVTPDPDTYLLFITAFQAVSARAGMGGSSFRHRSDMLGMGFQRMPRDMASGGRLVPVFLTTL